MGESGQNIADFNLGRKPEGGSALCLVSLDAPLPDEVMSKIEGLDQVKMAKKLSF